MLRVLLLIASPRLSSETVPKRYERGVLANKVSDGVGSRKWNDVSNFKSPSIRYWYNSGDCLSGDKRVGSAGEKQRARTHTDAKEDVHERTTWRTIGSGNGFLPLRRTLLYFTDSRRFSPRNSTTFLLSAAYSAASVCQESCTRQTCFPVVEKFQREARAINNASIGRCRR